MNEHAASDCTPAGPASSSAPPCRRPQHLCLDDDTQPGLSNLVILAKPDSGRCLSPVRCQHGRRLAFICSVNATLMHGQAVHLVTASGQIYPSVIAQLAHDHRKPPVICNGFNSTNDRGSSVTIPISGQLSRVSPTCNSTTDCLKQELGTNDERQDSGMMATEPAAETSSDCGTFDALNLEEIKEFAKCFKMKRLSLGLTQTQVGQALSLAEGPAYSQSAICRFEKLDITPKSAQKIKPVLERWMRDMEHGALDASPTTRPADESPTPSRSPPAAHADVGRKRKRRTSFTPQALDVLNRFFQRNTHPTGAEMTLLAETLHYDREVVRVWFCNKRQALKNTLRKLNSVECML